MVEDRPIMSAEYRLPLLAKTESSCSAVSLRAQLLVQSYITCHHFSLMLHFLASGDSHSVTAVLNDFKINHSRRFLSTVMLLIHCNKIKKTRL